MELLKSRFVGRRCRRHRGHRLPCFQGRGKGAGCAIRFCHIARWDQGAIERDRRGASGPYRRGQRRNRAAQFRFEHSQATWTRSAGTVNCRSQRTDFLQHWQQVRDEFFRVLAHREMAETFHDCGGRARALGDVERCLGCAGIVIFAGQQEQRTAFDVDLVEPVANVAVECVEIEVALEHAWAALHVVPECFPAFGGGHRWRDQAGDHAGADHSAMHVGPVEPGQIVISLCVGRRLQSDQGAKALRMLMREMQHDAAADRAAHDDRVSRARARLMTSRIIRT